MTTLLKKEKYAPLVIYMRSLGKLGCPVFFPHQFYPTARIIAQFASFIIWCEANDRISFRGEQRAAAAMFSVSPLHRQTDVFVSQINWPCSPPTNESKGAEVQKQVLCSSEDAQWNNKGQAGYLQKKLLMDMCRLLSSSAAGWHPCV